MKHAERKLEQIIKAAEINGNSRRAVDLPDFPDASESRVLRVFQEKPLIVFTSGDGRSAIEMYKVASQLGVSKYIVVKIGKGYFNKDSVRIDSQTQNHQREGAFGGKVVAGDMLRFLDGWRQSGNNAENTQANFLMMGLNSEVIRYCDKNRDYMAAAFSIISDLLPQGGVLIGSQSTPWVSYCRYVNNGARLDHNVLSPLGPTGYSMRQIEPDGTKSLVVLMKT